MDVYVAVVSHHGKPEKVQVFMSEDEARRFAVDLSAQENWENKAEHDDHDHDDEDHVHESEWLEDWGDDDGCGVVAGLAAAP